MQLVNIEIKARCADLDAVRDRLRAMGARFEGEDHQVDTYYRVPSGRLKLREGAIEHSLIFYRRPDDAGPKQSDVQLVRDPDGGTGPLLREALGVWAVVDKRREIWYADNVKCHLDRIDGLGTFVEIEAMDVDGSFGVERLHEQCAEFMQRFDIAESDLVTRSYSDLIAERDARAEPAAAPAKRQQIAALRMLDPRIRNVWRIKLSITLGVVLIVSLVWEVSHLFDPDRMLPNWLLPMGVLAVGVLMIAWIPSLRYRFWRFALTDEELLLEYGILNRIRTIVPLRRIQHLDVSQDILEREFDLGKLVVHTAGTRSSEVLLPGLLLTEAEQLRDQIKETITDEPV